MSSSTWLGRGFLRRVSLFIFTATLVVAAGNANATCDKDSCTNQIRRIYTDGATTYIQLSGSETSTNCTLISGVYAALPTSNPNYKALLAHLMMAYAMNVPISLRYNDGGGACTIAYLYLDKG